MKCKVSISNLRMYLVILIFLPPGCLPYIGGGSADRIWSVLKYVISAMIILSILQRTKRKCVDNIFSRFLILYILFCVLSMLFNGTYYLMGALSFIPIVSCVFFNMVTYKRKDIQLVKAYKNIIFFYMLLNFLTQIVIPNGFVKNVSLDRRVFFIGEKNGAAIYALIFMFCLMIYKTEKYISEKKFIFEIILFDLFLVVNGSSTALIGVFIVQIYIIFDILFYRFPQIRKIILKLTLVLGSLIVVTFISRVVFSGEKMEWLSFITSIFKKDITFSGRVGIWKVASKYIQANPLWGQGMDVSFDAWGNGVIVKSAHNTFLDCSVKYGVPAMIFILAVLGYVFVCVVKKYKNAIPVIVFISLLVVLQFEAMEQSLDMWTILTLIYVYVKNKSKDKVNEERKYYSA